MKKIHIILMLVCLVITTSTQAQDIDKIRTSLTAAREAYDGGNYRTAISKIKEVEQLVGSTTKPATSYIKIMSYYKLRDYTNCAISASIYMDDNPAIDETSEEIIEVWQKALDELNNKNKAVEWLTQKLKEHFYFQKDLRVEVDPCQITIYYTRVKDKKNIRRKEVYPTKFVKIHKLNRNDDYHTISYSGKNISETNLDTGSTIYYANGMFLFLHTPSDIVKEIERKIKYLNTFCTD